MDDGWMDVTFMSNVKSTISHVGKQDILLLLLWTNKFITSGCRIKHACMEKDPVLQPQDLEQQVLPRTQNVLSCNLYKVFMLISS